jgi:hypothetical protein
MNNTWMKKEVLFFSFLAMFIIYSGCGALIEGDGNSVVPTGEVTFAVKWDTPPENDPAQTAPNKLLTATQGIKVTVTGPNISTPIVNGVNRTTGATQATITLSNVPVGQNTFAIEAFNIDWTQATGANLVQKTITPFTVQGGTANSLTVTLADDLCFSVAVSPANKTFGVGDTQLFTAAARNADNEILLSKTFSWSSTNQPVATVDSASGLATAQARGTATLQAACDSRSGPAALTVIIANPKNLTATPGDRSVTLAWNTVAGASGYRFYYRATPGVTKLNGTGVTSATNSFTLSGLVNGTTYYFVATAMTGTEESLDSNEASARPAIPTGSVDLTIN